MSIIDNLLVLQDNAALTATAASTNVVDQLAANVAIGNELYVETIVTTVLASSGKSATLTMTLQGATTEAFSSPITLGATEAIAEASLVAGYVRRIRIPIEQGYRYLRMYYTVGTENFTSGKISAYFIQTPFERV
jgi:hypothetical protein